MQHPNSSPIVVENAPLLRALGADGARRMALAIRVEPRLGERLALAPRRAVHATAAFLGSTEAGAMEAGALARALTSLHPRDLLPAAVPDADTRLYRLLERAALPAWGLAEYRMLGALLRAGLSHDLLGTASFSARDVTRAGDLLSDDLVLRSWLRPFQHGGERRSVRTALLYLRRAGLLNAAERLPDGAGPAAVARRLARALLCAEAPDVAFPAVPGWRRLRSPREVFNAGRSLRNCLRPEARQGAERVTGLLTGGVILLLHEEAMVVAEFLAAPGGAWSVGDVLGQGNDDPPDGLVDGLLTSIRDAGVIVLPERLDEALRTVLAPLRREANWDDELPVLVGADDEWA